MTINDGRRQFAGRHSGRQAPPVEPAGQSVDTPPAETPPATPTRRRRVRGLSAGRAMHVAKTGTPEARRQAREVLDAIEAGPED